MVLEAWKSKIKVSALGETLFLAYQLPPSHCVLNTIFPLCACGDKALMSLPLLARALISSNELHPHLNLITSQWPHHLLLSHGELGLHHMYFFQGHKHSAHNKFHNSKN